MINSKNLIAEVKMRFPDFGIINEMDELPTVIFAFLSDELISAIHSKDRKIKNEFSELINKMAESDDKVVVSSFSEIVAVLCDNLEKNELEEYMSSLSVNAQELFSLNIKLWNSQFSK